MWRELENYGERVGKELMGVWEKFGRDNGKSEGREIQKSGKRAGKGWGEIGKRIGGDIQESDKRV